MKIMHGTKFVGGHRGGGWQGEYWRISGNQLQHHFSVRVGLLGILQFWHQSSQPMKRKGLQCLSVVFRMALIFDSIKGSEGSTPT
mmetsp:Transcript_13412/g.29130  ORF Transcript_13412/g.29130 Transcript_13412/m.29130 type:complete len:85 (-) Transcript_13412:3069-3323(-)